MAPTVAGATDGIDGDWPGKGEAGWRRGVGVPTATVTEVGADRGTGVHQPRLCTARATHSNVVGVSAAGTELTTSRLTEWAMNYRGTDVGDARKALPGDPPLLAATVF